VKRRDVVFSPEAVDDLDALFDFVRDNAGAERASAWLGRLEAHCQSYDFASERGASRNDVRHGLRISSFERRITIAFTVTPT
jgi:toxin ParE1/3/4